MKIRLLSLLLLLGAAKNLNAQFDLNSESTFFEQCEQWDAYYDSVAESRQSLGIEDMKGTGYSGYLRWKNYWENYMPLSGRFEDALEILKINQTYLKKQHFDTYFQQPKSLIDGPVEWDELGPFNLSQILTKTTSGWQQVHQNNLGNVQSAAHVAKIDRLLQHPTEPNKIFACAGGKDAGGGGLFISEDFGHTWRIFGTDNIPNPDVLSFAVKPTANFRMLIKNIIFWDSLREQFIGQKIMA